jgi:hypothetical protein
MPNIDITVSPDLSAMFQLPACASVRLQVPKPISLQLPGGASMQSFSDISKGFPTPSAMTFSLMMQMAPFLASIQPLVKVLNFVMTVQQVLSNFNPLNIPGAVASIVQAADEVVKVAVSYTPAGLVPFILDLMSLILTALKGFVTEMEAVVSSIKLSSIQIQIASDAGNGELLSSLNCAQANAFVQAQALLGSLGPIGVILQLAGDFLKLLNISPITLPTSGSIGNDVAALESFLEDFDTVITDVQAVVTALGGGS